MSKRNHIVERASDVNGGQYIQTNPSYNSGYEDGKKAGKEYCSSEIEALRKQVKKLTEERDATDERWMKTGAQREGELMEAKRSNRALQEQLEKLRVERDALKTVPMKYRRMQFNAELQEEVMQLNEQLLALAEQNAKMRKALTKWLYLESSYNWRCGHCGNEVEDGHKEGCALYLPDLATIILNKEEGE